MNVAFHQAKKRKKEAGRRIFPVTVQVMSLFLIMYSFRIKRKCSSPSLNAIMKACDDRHYAFCEITLSGGGECDTGCIKIIDPPMSFAEKLILYFRKRSFALNHMSV